MELAREMAVLVALEPVAVAEARDHGPYAVAQRCVVGGLAIVTD